METILIPVDQGKKRNPATILCDVIMASYNGARKTHIMYRANLNPAILEKYLRFCLENGLIQKENITYRATRKGVEVARRIEEINTLSKNIEVTKKQVRKLIVANNFDTLS
ncbi:MAG: winged helix-turn-helix domain-containing protein [Thermoprotei archaeon]